MLNINLYQPHMSSPESTFDGNPDLKFQNFENFFFDFFLTISGVPEAKV